MPVLSQSVVVVASSAEIVQQLSLLSEACNSLLFQFSIQCRVVEFAGVSRFLYLHNISLSRWISRETETRHPRLAVDGRQMRCRDLFLLFATCKAPFTTLQHLQNSEFHSKVIRSVYGKVVLFNRFKSGWVCFNNTSRSAQQFADDLC